VENREAYGTEVTHVTRDSDITFKVKRSKVNLQGAGAYCGGLSHSLFYSVSLAAIIHYVIGFTVYNDYECVYVRLSHIINIIYLLT